jgi:hypothetical protein
MAHAVSHQPLIVVACFGPGQVHVGFIIIIIIIIVIIYCNFVFTRWQ